MKTVIAALLLAGLILTTAHLYTSAGERRYRRETVKWELIARHETARLAAVQAQLELQRIKAQIESTGTL